MIAITHLPQVASRAAAHFSVEKKTGAGTVAATVTALDFCELYVIDRRDFLSFLARHPGVQSRVNEVAEARRRMNDPVEEA